MLRIVPAAAVVVLVAAGCGSAARPQSSPVHGVPRSLASDWEGQASHIANVAAAGNDCEALQLAGVLRDDIIAAQPRLPARLYLPLITGVNSLADRLTCTRTVTVQTTPEKPPKPPHKHDNRGHGDQGNQG